MRGRQEPNPHNPAIVADVRLVLDTNVALSALLWRGTPYRLLQAIGQRNVSAQTPTSIDNERDRSEAGCRRSVLAITEG